MGHQKDQNAGGSGEGPLSMSEIVCQVGNQASEVEFIWSSRGGFFPPYKISGQKLTELRRAADRSVTGPSTSEKPSCREALEKLVFALNRAGAGPPPWEPSYELAEAGFRLFNCLLPPEDATPKKVRRWLEDLRKQSGLIGLEVVVEERSADAGTFLSVPWNLVYDERPAKYKAAFQKGEGAERWRPFWSARYNLTSGRRVEPLKRLPLWVDPRVVVVVDPTVHDGLDDEQKQRLDQFLAEAGLTAAGSMNELEAALEEGYPRLLYWLGHATPEYLQLGDERIAPGDLRNLLRSFDNRERPEGMLAFLNACQTAEAGSGGSFLDVLHSFGFTGAIATERQTIDTFANEFGLSFLQGFLREGKPLGELLHGLRLKSAPLGLLYGAHCPPEIRVQRPGDAADTPSLLPIRESGPVAGVPLGAAVAEGTESNIVTAEPERVVRKALAASPLPDTPYRSLAFYDWKDRALFTGRDADVVRFAAALDRPDTRILVLHGESGTGKSSFLRAAVIPYLEEECVGYRFLRRPDGSMRVIQPAKDLVGGAAQALLDATATTLRYKTPEGEQETVNLRLLIDEAVGAPADFATLREALRRDSQLLADILARIAGRLPYSLVLVFDQIEEVFTLAKTPEEVAVRDHALRMLQRVVDVRADVKLIISLRTEYYGRLLDHLRAGRRDLTGVRDDLLRDFSRSALIEAITRPTSETPLADGQPSPREKYGFGYAEGIPEAIADGVLALRSENQDSVLPLVQVICTQLYERKKSLPRSDGVITREDLDAIKGVEGGLKAFAEDALERSLRLGPEDREAFKALFSQLHNRQPDGTLTTWLMPRASLESQWDCPSPFADVLEAAKSVRLLREDELRIEAGEPRRYIRLGHDALAKVAAAWQAEREEKQRLEQERGKRRKQLAWMIGGTLATALLAVIFYTLKVDADKAAGAAKLAEAEAVQQNKLAVLGGYNGHLATVEATWRNDRQGALRILTDDLLCPLEQREFAWRYLYRMANRGYITIGPRHQPARPELLAVAPGAEVRIAWVEQSGRLMIWRPQHEEAPQELIDVGQPMFLAFSADGRELIWFDQGQAPQTLNMETNTRSEVVSKEPWKNASAMTVSRVRPEIYWSDGTAIHRFDYRLNPRRDRITVGALDATTTSKELMTKLQLSADGNTIVATHGGRFTVIHLAPPIPQSTRIANSTYIGTCISVSPNGHRFVLDGDPPILFDESQSRRTPLVFFSPDNGFGLAAADFSPDGSKLAIAMRHMDLPGYWGLWDLETGQFLAVRVNGTRYEKGKEDFVYVRFVGDDRGLMSWSERTTAGSRDDGYLKIWDSTIGVTKLRSVPDWAVNSQAGFSKNTFKPPYDLRIDGNAIFLRSTAKTGLPTSPISGPRGHSLRSAAVSPDRTWLACICKTEDKQPQQSAFIRRLNGQADDHWMPLSGNATYLNTLAFSPDGRRLAVGGGGKGDPSDRTGPPGESSMLSAEPPGAVDIWDVDGVSFVKPMVKILSEKGAVNAMAFSPDGMTLATADNGPGYGESDLWNGSVRLWDPQTGQLRMKLRGHNWHAHDVAFSPDGLQLVSRGGPSNDDVLLLWDATPWTQVGLGNLSTGLGSDKRNPVPHDQSHESARQR